MVGITRSKVISSAFLKSIVSTLLMLDSTTGMLMLDLGEMVAHDLAKKRGCKKRQIWLDSRTALTLKDICGSVLCCAYAGKTPLHWPKITERKLECRFGRIRSSFCTGQVTIADYWRASLRLMKREMRDELAEPCDPPEAITDDEFVKCGDRAFAACRKLMAMCYKCSTKDIQEIFDMASGGQIGEEDQQEDEVDEAPAGSDGSRLILRRCFRGNKSSKGQRKPFQTL